MTEAPKSRSAIAEVLVWALLAFMSASFMRALRPMPLADDSYQYLNVAENFSQGRGLTTSLVHFDAERSHGQIPAPLTTFPPGYPIAIAAASFGGDLQAAARLLSSVCYSGTAALLAWALVAAGAAAFLRQVVLLLFVTNAVALDFATSVFSEPLFMLLATSAVALLISAERAQHHVILRAVIAHSIAGLAYWVRYAGLFLIVALVAYAFVRLVVERNRLRAILASTTLIPIALSAVLMLRNVVVVRTWKGGNEMAVYNSLKSVTLDYVRAHLHLMLGGHAVTFGIWEGLLLAVGLGLACLVLAELRKANWSQPDPATLLVGLCIVIYSAGMFYAGLRTVISFGTRMFFPALPLYLLLLGLALSSLQSRLLEGARNFLPLWKPALLLLVVGYAGVNARDLYQPRAPAPHEVLAAMYAQPAADGQPLIKWVESNIGARDVIVATDGQATGYLLHRPTVSMIGAHYSPVRWECDEVNQEMRRFGSTYVILYKPSSARDDSFLLDESQFVASSVSGQPLCGFAVAAENSNVRILKAQ
jgi:hypothetical protein